MAAEEINKRIHEAALLLANARRTGVRLQELPESCRPQSVPEAEDVQDLVAAELGERIGGWKCHHRSFAPIYASQIHASPADIPSDMPAMCGVESEIVFRLTRDLPARDQPYGREEVMEAVTLHPGIELLESRFLDIRAIKRLSAVADNITNGGLVYGPAATGWEKLKLDTHTVKVTKNGRLFIFSSGNRGGDPIASLVVLVNYLSQERGRLGMKAGTSVTTGSLTGIVFAEPGAHVVADFGRLGKVEVSFPLIP